ncbi:Cationic peroxidase 1 [Bienertia sinuspersici]
MASFSSSSSWLLLLLCMLFFGSAFAHLSENFYATSCPKALSIIESGVKSAISKDRSLGPSLFKLHFHDCLVGGCDASLLLDGTLAEKNTMPDHNPQKYEVIDEIKAELEKECPGVVSCTDILSVVARDSVVQLGGPNWTVPLGRRDSTKANSPLANIGILSLLGGLNAQISGFERKGFSKQEFVALTGGHTIGMARCLFYKKRIHEKKSDIDPEFAKALQKDCPIFGGDDHYTPIDSTTPLVFDNAYFTNLINKKGLLQSDQDMYTGKGGVTDDLVLSYSKNNDKFFEDFAKAVVKVGFLDVLTGNNGVIRTNCRKVDGKTGRTEL